MRFKNRASAARLLAKRLQAYRGSNPLVAAIPRGAVPMARIIADELRGEVDVVLVHKLGAPGSAELAIGSVGEDAHVFLAARAREFGVTDAYLDAETRRQLDALAAKRRLYSPHRSPMSPAGRVVIVVDDGLATGFTMMAALRALRDRKPARLVAAVPVAPRDTVARIRALADEVVCLHTPVDFQAVGQFYDEFPQVDDDEVIAALREEKAPAK